jgi:hypothetical protein
LIRNLNVVQVRHREVRVAPDTDLGQVYDCESASQFNREYSRLFG